MVFSAFKHVHFELINFLIFDHDLLLIMKQIVLNALDLLSHAFLKTPFMLKLMYKLLYKLLKLSLHGGVKLTGLLLLVIKATPGTVVVIALCRGFVETGAGFGAVAGCGVFVVLLVGGGLGEGLDLVLERVVFLLCVEQLLFEV
jgi:hypothetical protein